MASRRKSAPRTLSLPTSWPVFGGAGVVTIALFAWFIASLFNDPTSEPVGVVGIGDNEPTKTAESTSLEPPANQSLSAAESLETVDPESLTPPLPERAWQEVTVRPGQSMDRIFKDLGLSASLLHRLVRLDERTKQLVNIKPGDVFYFALDPTGRFEALKGDFDDAHWLLGLSDNMTMKLANVFGWDIDFALDIRRGDRFSVLYEEIWRDGAFFKDGSILAARFVNRGDVFDAIRFDDGNGPDYFDPQGRPMRKAFLRAPLNFTRVTSNFNPRRFHPVTQRIRPHNGTDYGAATGTPVWSAGDGTVIESAYNRVNGHYVFVQHGNQIVTRYLHLNRRDVKRGDRVRQGQTIGTVGSTGLATGPHLHYEFLVNGAHRDPRKVDLPPANPLPDSQRLAFQEHAQDLIARLDRFDNQTRLLASMAGKDCQEQTESC